jgi:hypothetical protein
LHNIIASVIVQKRGYHFILQVFISSNPRFANRELEDELCSLALHFNKSNGVNITPYMTSNHYFSVYQKPQILGLIVYQKVTNFQ